MTFQLIIGRWKLSNAGLFYRHQCRARKHPKVNWFEWRRIL